MYIENDKHDNLIKDNLSGANLYLDHLNRVIYQNKLKNKFYLINNNDYKILNICNHRFIISLLLATIILFLFKGNYNYFISLGCFIFVYCFLYYRLLQILKISKEINIDIKKLTSNIYFNARQSRKRLNIKSLIYLFIGFIVIVNGLSNNNIYNLVIYIILGCIYIYFCLKEYLLLRYKIKNNL